MANTITLLVPVGENRPAHGRARGLPDRLEGTRIGFLDNTKANFAVLAGEVARDLRERFGAASVTIRRKLNAATPAPPELLAALARECDLVFAGSGD